MLLGLQRCNRDVKFEVLRPRDADEARSLRVAAGSERQTYLPQ